MELTKYINKKLCVLLNSTTKESALKELVEIIIKEKEMKNEETILKEILYREKLMSTGIGLGIAIPHIRIEDLNDFIIAIGIQKNGIEDYESIDNKIVKIVIMILVDKGKHREYIKLLSNIVTLFKNEEFVNVLLKSQNGEEIYNTINEYSIN